MRSKNVASIDDNLSRKIIMNCKYTLICTLLRGRIKKGQIKKYQRDFKHVKLLRTLDKCTIYEILLLFEMLLITWPLCEAEFFITSHRMSYVYNRACGRFIVLLRINIRICTRMKIPDVCARSSGKFPNN